jgi:tetratricopeptide (TPR) repeat protein
MTKDEVYAFFTSHHYKYEKEVVFYFFLEDWIFEEESAELHSTAAVMMSFGLNWMPGAYNVALRHLQRALELDPDNVSYKDLMLLFYEIPERLLTLEQAAKFAKDIIKEKPENLSAQRVLKRYQERSK